jgi:hypothetical protein
LIIVAERAKHKNRKRITMYPLGITSSWDGDFFNNYYVKDVEVWCQGFRCFIEWVGGADENSLVIPSIITYNIE